MKLNEQDLNSFTVAVLKTYNLREFNVDKEKAYSFLQNEISQEFIDLNSSETMKLRHDFFKIGDPSDYGEYLIELEDNKKLICGIRHFGRNPDYPFINCTPNFGINSKVDAENVADQIKERFQKFNPLWLNFWSAKEIEIDFIGSVYLVSQFDGTGEGEITLELVKDESYYNWYKSGYEEFHQEQPELRTKVTLNEPEVMNESLEQGLLFYAKKGDQRVGLIAGVKSEFLGHPGIYFNEIFVTKDFRGRGLAKLIQSKFLNNNASIGEFIWGTIDHHNRPSYQTAIANKRRPIRYECFLKVRDSF